MSNNETAAILTAREGITTFLENEEYAEDFYFTGKIHFIGNRVWHEILITDLDVLIYAFLDNSHVAHTVAELSEAAYFDSK